MADHPKLTVLNEKLRGKTFELDKESISVGRKESMDICIKDASLSGHHCDFIRTESGNYILRDNNSTNGTRINNVELKTEQELRNSDIIQLGAVEILYDSAVGGDSDTSANGFGGRTHTISLEDMSSNLSTTHEVSNYSPFAGREQKIQKRNHLIMMLLIGILGVALLALVAYLAYVVLG